VEPTDRTFDELRRHARLMQTLSEVSRAAMEEDDLGRLLHRVVDYIAARLEVPVASILLLDEGARKFVDEVYAGDLHLLSPGDAAEWPVTVGVCGRCARTGQPQLVTDVGSDRDYVPGHPDVRAEYVTPIRYRGRILGVLNVEGVRSDAFGEDHRRVLDAIAVQVAGSIHLASVNRKLEEANRELERLSQLDGLTGVANRRAFDATLEREWRRAVRERRWTSLLLADLDHFKLLNDELGHLHGDDCLRRAARVLTASARRAADLVARYGGEEFAILLPGAGPDAAAAIAETVRAGIEALELGRGPDGISTSIPVTVSIGIASALPIEHEPTAFVGAADRALYLAKRKGRNRVEMSVQGPAPAAGPTGTG
jgi:diguanylate cyclase (GGDEF)-like protein